MTWKERIESWDSVRTVAKTPGMTPEKFSELMQEPAVAMLADSRYSELVNLRRCQCGATLVHYDKVNGGRRANVVMNIVTLNLEVPHWISGRCRKCNLRHDMDLYETEVRFPNNSIKIIGNC